MISTGLHFHFISGAATGIRRVFLREELRLLPGRKCPPKLVVVDELRIGDTFDTEERVFFSKHSQ